MDARGEELRVVADEKGAEHTWIYRDGLWSLKGEPSDPWLEHQIEMTLREMKCSSASKARFITEARKYIERSPTSGATGTIVWDDHGKVPTRSGLIDPRTLKLEPLKKEHYATWRIDVDYDPTATCPLWEEMLGDYFPELCPDEREKSIMLLQELLGTIADRPAAEGAEMRAGAVVPAIPARAQLLRILSGLTSDNPIGTPLSEINKTHGLEEFTRRAPWVLDEAFNISVWHLSDHVKAIIARETLGINVKNHPLLTMPIYAPAFWGTNHPPTFKENTDAMVNRLLIVPLKRVFEKGEHVGVAAKARAVNPAWEPSDLILDREKAGLLNWVLIGLQRAAETRQLRQHRRRRQPRSTR